MRMTSSKHIDDVGAVCAVLLICLVVIIVICCVRARSVTSAPEKETQQHNASATGCDFYFVILLHQKELIKIFVLLFLQYTYLAFDFTNVSCRNISCYTYNHL